MKALRIIFLIKELFLFVICWMVLYPGLKQYWDDSVQHIWISELRPGGVEITSSNLIITGVPLYQAAVRKIKKTGSGTVEYLVPMVDPMWTFDEPVYCILEYPIGLFGYRMEFNDSLNRFDNRFAALADSFPQVTSIAVSYRSFGMIDNLIESEKELDRPHPLKMAGWLDLKRVVVNGKKSLAGILTLSVLTLLLFAHICYSLYKLRKGG